MNLLTHQYEEAVGVAQLTEQRGVGLSFSVFLQIPDFEEKLGCFILGDSKRCHCGTSHYVWYQCSTSTNVDPRISLLRFLDSHHRRGLMQLVPGHLGAFVVVQ